MSEFRKKFTSHVILVTVLMTAVLCFLFVQKKQRETLYLEDATTQQQYQLLYIPSITLPMPSFLILSIRKRFSLLWQKPVKERSGSNSITGKPSIAHCFHFTGICRSRAVQAFSISTCLVEPVFSDSIGPLFLVTA